MGSFFRHLTIIKNGLQFFVYHVSKNIKPNYRDKTQWIIKKAGKWIRTVCLSNLK